MNVPSRQYPARVAEVRWETAEAATLILDLPDDALDAFAGKPGQFIGVHVTGHGIAATRYYSLTGLPGRGERLAITVKRVEGGQVSNFILDHLGPGDPLLVDPPLGRFVLRDTQRPLLCFAAGSGITPVYSLIRAALEDTERTMTLLFVNRAHVSAIFHDALDRLQRTHSGRFRLAHHLTGEAGRVDANVIAAFLSDAPSADVYVCGPGPFMDLVEGVATPLLPPDRLFTERFSTPPAEAAEAMLDLPATTPGTTAEALVTVRLDGIEHAVRWQGEPSLLEAFLAQGMAFPHSCREGHCGACVARLVSGEVDLGEVRALSPRDRQRGLILCCRSTPRSGQLALDADI